MQSCCGICEKGREDHLHKDGIEGMYPSDVTDEEWEFLLAYLIPLSEIVMEGTCSFRDILNGLLWFIQDTGAASRLPADLPPWSLIYRQSQQWFASQGFEAMLHDVHFLLRNIPLHRKSPDTVVLDTRVFQRTTEALKGLGHTTRTPYSTITVDSPASLFMLFMSRMQEEDRVAIEAMVRAMRKISGSSIAVTLFDRSGQHVECGELGEIRLIAIKMKASARGIVLLPEHWVLEGTFSWVSRLRRLLRVYEHLPEAFSKRLQQA